MAERTTEATQRLAARIAGFTLLLLMASGFAGMFAFGRGHIIAGDAAATSRHTAAARWFTACSIYALVHRRRRAMAA